MKKTIQKLKPSDHAEFKKWAGEQSRSPLFNWSQESLLESFESKSCYGLFDDNILKSVVCYLIQPGHAEILWLATLPAARGLGLMKELLEQSFLDVARHDSAASFRVLLEVHEENKNALKLYSSLGFIELARRKNYYKDGAAALVLSLNLQ